MEPRLVLEQLVGLAEEAGIAVRVARAAESETPPRSGVCVVRGRPLLVISAAEPLEARIEAVVAALREHGGGALEERFLPPAVRERLERRPLPRGSR
jgi:hypothetical protein